MTVRLDPRTVSDDEIMTSARIAAGAARRIAHGALTATYPWSRAKARHRAAIRHLENKARAWEKMSEALDANANGESHSSAADVCAVGFHLQERLRNGEQI